ncbi:MAG: 4'-phosphopantetheinyl transferase superfamily protein [Bacteroidota bacterium]
MWNVASIPSPLKKNVIHVWKYRVSDGISSMNDHLKLLSDQEKQRADRYRFEVDRERFIISHSILRILLGHYLGQEPDQITFSFGHQQKPELRDYKRLTFNMSHSEDYAVYGYCLDYDIGIDVEYVKKDIEFEIIARQFFSEKECAALFSLEKKNLATGFFNCWTRKEAFIKAIGDGLTFPLDQFAVTLKPGKSPELTELKSAPTSLKQWSLYAFSPREDYIGACAVNGPVSTVNYFQFEKS